MRLFVRNIQISSTLKSCFLNNFSCDFKAVYSNTCMRVCVCVCLSVCVRETELEREREREREVTSTRCASALFTERETWKKLHFCLFVQDYEMKRTTWWRLWGPFWSEREGKKSDNKKWFMCWPRGHVRALACVCPCTTRHKQIRRN